MDKNKQKKSPDELKSLFRAFSIFTGVGIYIAVVILICLYLGGIVDDWLELDGKGRLGGIIISFPIAFYSIYRQIKNGGMM